MHGLNKKRWGREGECGRGKERCGRVKKVLGLKREGGDARESVSGEKRKGKVKMMFDS